MTLTATIIALEAGERFSDGKQRVTLRFSGCDPLFNEIRFADDGQFKRGQRLTVEITEAEVEATCQ
jgi:hypothetical protein